MMVLFETKISENEIFLDYGQRSFVQNKNPIGNKFDEH